MALSSSRFVPYAVHLVGSSAWINQIDATPINPGVALFEESTGSQTDRSLVAARSIDPTVPITTSDLNILATIGYAGLSWNGASAVPVVLYGRELPLGAVPTAVGSSVHLQASISDGLLVPMNLSAGHNSVAKLQLMLHALLGSGGSAGARPIVLAKNQTISTSHTPEPAAQTMFTTGVVHFVSGAASPAVSPRLLTGITALSVDFGIGVEKEGTDGDVYPSFAAIISRTPRIEFTTRDLTLAVEVGDGISVSAFDAYFRKIDANGQRVAVATTEHIKLTGKTGMIVPGGITLAHKRPGEATFTFIPASAAPNLAISNTSAIPTSA